MKIVNDYRWRMYRDSCKTALIIAAGSVISLMAGALDAAFPPAAPYLIVEATAIALGVIYITYLADTSRLNAIFVRYAHGLVTAGRQ